MNGDSWRLRRLTTEDTPSIRAIFNHYVKTSFAAYPQRSLSEDDVRCMVDRCGNLPAYVARTLGGEVAGFAFMRPYSPHDTFSATALVTYFVAPGHVRQGLGTVLLEALEKGARAHGVQHLLAHVSSENAASLRFHEKQGFTRCGTFHQIGCKNSVPFDVVWFEKTLEPSRDSVRKRSS
jgi:L-amino acid N-acyltransferase YncA